MKSPNDQIYSLFPDHLHSRLGEAIKVAGIAAVQIACAEWSTPAEQEWGLNDLLRNYDTQTVVVVDFANQGRTG